MRIDNGAVGDRMGDELHIGKSNDRDLEGVSSEFLDPWERQEFEEWLDEQEARSGE